MEQREPFSYVLALGFSSNSCRSSFPCLQYSTTLQNNLIKAISETHVKRDIQELISNTITTHAQK